MGGKLAAAATLAAAAGVTATVTSTAAKLTDESAVNADLPDAPPTPDAVRVMNPLDNIQIPGVQNPGLEGFAARGNSMHPWLLLHIL